MLTRNCPLRKSAEPSGNLRQTIVGIVSIKSRRRSSKTFEVWSASLCCVLAPVWLMVPSTRPDLAVVSAFAPLSSCEDLYFNRLLTVPPPSCADGTPIQGKWLAVSSSRPAGPDLHSSDAMLERRPAD